MDNESGDNETEELREFDWEEWSEFGWRNEAGSLLLSELGGFKNSTSKTVLDLLKPV